MGRRGTRLHGRSHEMSALMSLLDQAEDERADTVLLVGDAGMGKTALLDEFARQARRRQVRVARAAGAQGGEVNAFSLVEDLARCLPEHVAVLPDDDGRLLRAPPRDGTVGPGPIADALLHLLGEAGHHQPVLVLLDDLQWADAGSLVALCLTVGRLGHDHVTVVAAARPRPALDPRLDAWSRLEVGPLDLDAAVSVLRSALTDRGDLAEGALTDQQAQRLAEALGRCPLALVESGRLLSADQLTGREALPDPLPLAERLGAAWGRSWSDLPEPTRTALLALAVTQGVGGVLTSRVLADLGVRQEELDPAAADGLLDPRSLGRDGVARLAHPLIRDAILAAAGPPEVRAMHAEAADAAESLGLPPSVVIAHVVAAATPGDADASAHLVSEAARAEAAGFGDSATHALVAAAELALTATDRSRLAALAARTLMEWSFDYADIARILTLADVRMLTAEERFWVDWLRSEWLVEEDLRGALRTLRDTAEHARRIDSPMLPWIEFSALTSAWALWDGRAAIRHARALRALADRPDADTDGRMPAWACRGMYALALFQVGQVRAADGELEAVRALSRRWRPAATSSPVQRLEVATVDCQMATLDPWVDYRLEALAQAQAGDPGETLGFLRRVQAERALRRGHLAMARALIDEARALGHGSASRVTRVDWLTVSLRIAAATGDVPLLARQAAELQAVAARIGWLDVGAVADRARGLAALGEGRLDDALGHLEALADAPLLGKGPWDSVPTGRADLVEALSRSGEAHRATQVATALVDVLAPSRDPFARGLVARATGLVTRGDPAHEALTTAATAFDEAGDPFEAARTRLLLGELLRRERRIQAARHELRTALAAFERMGAPVWAGRARGELRATHASVPAQAPDPLSTLTPQERRVAEAVATGATDRQVGSDLFLSPRTVAFHLSSVYRKLGVSGRAALAARLAQAAVGNPQSGPG